MLPKRQSWRSAAAILSASGGRELHMPATLLDRTSTTHPELVVPILSCGLLAHQFCQNVAFAKVEAVFDRCFYLRAGDDFICVGERHIGNGPVTLTVNHFAVPNLELLAGQVASIDNHSIAIGS